MSVKVMSLVWDRAPLEGGDLLVLLALADWANDAGVCWPAMLTIANKARMSERNARYVIKRLMDDEWLSKDEQRGRNHSNIYTLNLQKLQDLPVRENPQNLQVINGGKPAIHDTKPASCDIKPAIAIAPKPSLEPSVEPNSLSPACEVFASAYGHAPHLHGQEEMTAEGEMDIGVWREVVKQCRANLTPAKNVGTMLKMYREQLERKGAAEVRAKAKGKSTRARPKEDDDEFTPPTVEQIMAVEGVTRERAEELLRC